MPALCAVLALVMPSEMISEPRFTCGVYKLRK
jgi:hypothetical protein